MVFILFCNTDGVKNGEMSSKVGGSPQPSISVTELGCISVSWTSRILPTCALLVAPRRLLAVRESVLTSRRDAVFDMLVQLLTYLLVVGRWASSIPLFQSIGRRTNQVAALSLRINRFLRACPTPSLPPTPPILQLWQFAAGNLCVKLQTQIDR